METIKLDLVPGKKMPSLHASQFDDGRAHGIDLYENGIEYKLDGTELLTINERKGDGNICSIDIENTFVGSSHIVFDSTEQMCAVAGANICELVIAKGEKTIGTLNFILEIEQSPTEGGIESDSQIKNLKRQIEAITEEVIGDNYYTAEETDDAIATATEGKADTTYVNTELDKKADKTDTYTKAQVDTIANRKMNSANPTGTGSIAVGSNMLNIGSNSQTFGSNTKALGNNAFATGENTQASVANQFVFGKYNQYSFGNLVEIVGNGTGESNRSNARTLDWQGNETLAGNLTYNGNKSLTSEISRLDGRIDTKANTSDVYTKSQTDNLLNGKADVSDLPDMTQYYDKSEVDTALGNKADQSDLSSLANVVSGLSDDVEALDQNKADKSDTYTKEQVDDIVYGILPDDTASGSVANFTTSLELPIKSLEIDVNAVQEAGTPTPSTPKAISGWSAITLDVNGNTEVINLGGTYYGGHFTQDKDGHRQFVVTHGIKSFSDIVFNYSNNAGQWQHFLFYGAINDKLSTSLTLLCTNYDVVNEQLSTISNEKMLVASWGNYIYIRDDAYTTVEDFKTANANTQVVYTLATPCTIDLPDGEPIITLNGTNNIHADTGDTEVVFKSSVNDYVSAHSGGNLLGMGGVYLGGAKSGGSEEETNNTEDTEKVKLDDPKEEVKTIVDTKKMGGE